MKLRHLCSTGVLACAAAVLLKIFGSGKKSLLFDRATDDYGEPKLRTDVYNRHHSPPAAARVPAQRCELRFFRRNLHSAGFTPRTLVYAGLVLSAAARTAKCIPLHSILAGCFLLHFSAGIAALRLERLR